MTADFPFARSLIVVRSERTIKKTGHTSTESRYYLSSAEPQAHRAEQWLKLIRGHWGGVEVRNHWRRDALMGEDASRSRNPNLLANVALIRSAEHSYGFRPGARGRGRAAARGSPAPSGALLRSALLALLAEHHPDEPLPQIKEDLHSRPSRCLSLINS